MADYRPTLLKLNNNLNTLREREAKYGGHAPLELLNQIKDHEQAISLTRQVITGEISEDEWHEACQPLLVSLEKAQVVYNQQGQYVDTQVNVAGDVEGDLIIHLAGKKIAVPRHIQWILGAIATGVFLLVGYQAWNLWLSLPPAKMPDDSFNIAVAKFTPDDTIQEEFDVNLAGSLARYLDTQKLEIIDAIGEDITVWGHKPTVEKILPPTEEEAEKRATDLNAKILVFGTLSKSENGIKIEPKFHISNKFFGLADELRGTFRLGEAILYNDPDSIGDINVSLRSRIEYFALFIRGLANYNSGTLEGYQKAAEKFELLADEPNNSLGKDVIYLFLGSTYMRQAWCYDVVNNKLKCSTKDEKKEPNDLLSERNGLLLQAYQAYSNSVKANHEYGRAHLGLGSVYFEQAQVALTHNQCAWDWNMLQAAQAAYEKALVSKDKPESGAVDLRANLGLGKVFFWRGVCNNLNETELQTATTYYETALTEYENLGMPLDLTYEAMLAHTDLGHIALLCHRYQKSLPNNKSPLIEMTNHYSRTIQLANAFNDDNSNDSAYTKIQVISNHKLAVLPFLIGTFCLTDRQDLAQRYLDQLSETDRPKVQSDVLENFGSSEGIQECIDAN